MAVLNSIVRSSEPSPCGIRRQVFLFLVALLIFPFLISPASAERIKDVASFEGVRTNQIIGYGLVVGLDGSGDTGDATLQSIATMLKSFGLTVRVKDIEAKNVASVMVTATLPPFPKPGIRIDAVVSTIGDAKSLQGGTLLLTPLKGPDGAVYALAQGPVSIGGFTGGGGGTTVQKNFPTVGKVPEGVTIEKDPQFVLGDGNEIKLFLHKPDFTTAAVVSRQINETLKAEYATPLDPSAILLKIPQPFRYRIVDLITLVEGINVTVDHPAKVVINERTGTVVIGDKVRIAPVAIAHGSLTIETRTEFQVSQPLPFSPKGAETTVVPQKDLSVKEQNVALTEVSGVTLGEIVRALNALGVTPRDLISILQALKASGALKAELEII